MTRKRAERLTGYEIRDIPAGRGLVGVGAFDGSNLICKATARAEWLALRRLVQQVYLANSVSALKENNWRCARCRSSRPLQIHHRRYRSHGGTHTVDNLEPLCWDCHRLIHETERSK